MPKLNDELPAVTLPFIVPITMKSPSNPKVPPKLLVLACRNSDKNHKKIRDPRNDRGNLFHKDAAPVRAQPTNANRRGGQNAI